jgi:hypothetical protein
MTIRDIGRQLGKLTRRLAGEQQAVADNVLVIDDRALPNRLQPLDRDRLAKLAEAEQRDMARGQPQVEQERRIAQAWEAAIEALPGGLRTAIEGEFALLAEAEQQLADKRRRLADLPSDGDEVWIQRRAQLTSAIEQLEDLVAERTRNCAGFCRSAVNFFDQRLAERVAEHDQAVTDAELYYADLLARSKAEIGRLKRERDAIATVRAEAHDPLAIERHMGRQVSPDPRQVEQAARKREKEAHALIGRSLAAGRVR